MKRRIVLLGPPASGKGTQAEMIQARYRIPSASPGTMLRDEKAAGTKLGIEADEMTSRGRLVSDDIINQLVERWIEKQDSEFVFDGYPRSQGQADALEAMLAKRETPLDVVLAFEADVATLRRRVQSRVVCSGCRRNFSLGLHVADAKAPCPHCGEGLGRRGDDTVETLALRMREYAEKTEPLVGYYSKRKLLQRVDATRPAEQVFATVAEILERG